MTLKPWIACVASTLLLSMAATSAGWDVFSAVLLLGGFFLSPLPGQLGRAALALSQGNNTMMVDALGKHLLPMVLLSVLLAMAYAASCSRVQQHMPITLPWVVLAGLGIGVALALQVPVAPELLGAFIVLPLVSVGLWMGAMLRRPTANLATPGPSHMMLSGSLTIFVALCSAWLVHKSISYPQTTAPPLQLSSQRPPPMPLARRMTPIKPAAPLSPVFADESTALPSEYSDHQGHYGQTTLANLQSLLPH